MKGIYKDLYKYAVNCWRYQGSKEEARDDLFSGNSLEYAKRFLLEDIQQATGARQEDACKLFAGLCDMADGSKKGMLKSVYTLDIYAPKNNLKPNDLINLYLAQPVDSYQHSKVFYTNYYSLIGSIATAKRGKYSKRVSILITGKDYFIISNKYTIHHTHKEGR